VSGLAYRHQRVQRLRRLVGRRSARQEEGRFVIEGVNLLEEALASRARLEAVFVDGEWARSGLHGMAPRVDDRRAPFEDGGAGNPESGGPDTGGPDTATADNGKAHAERPNPERLTALLRRCYDLGTRVFELEPGVLARVAGTVTPQPVMAIVETPAVVLADVLGASPRLIVVCIDVRDPGNAGTVVRSAWAAGADAVVSCDGTVDLWNPKAVRASGGAVLHLPVVAAGPAVPALDAIGAQGLQRWGTVREGGADYAAQDLALPSALVLGNEAAGLEVPDLRPQLDGLLSIPMPGGAESLNVGMAAAVLCFEVARQRRHVRPASAPAPAATGVENPPGV
jgi:RNA methyltransferase, TrmH family